MRAEKPVGTKCGGISWESKRRGRGRKERGKREREEEGETTDSYLCRLNRSSAGYIEEQALLAIFREDEPPQKKQSHRTKTDTKHNSMLGFDSKRT